MMPISAMRLRNSSGSPPVSGYAGEVLADSPLIYLRMAELSGGPVNSGSVSITGGSYSSSTRGQPTLCGDPADYSVSMSGGFSEFVRADFTAGTVIKANDFTIEGIIRPSDTSGTRGLIYTGSGPSAYLRLNAGKLNMLRSQAQDMGSGNTTLSAGTAYHIAVTVTSAGVTTFYLNGDPDGTATSYSSYPAGNGVIYFGSEGASFDPFAGRFDEGAYYGSALSPARIKAHAVAAGY